MQNSAIGMSVRVMIDRPLGSCHPKYSDMIYQVNYGFIPGIIGGDGEEQDAYVLGVREPVAECEGVVIAVIHRFDDVEEKWVVAPHGMNFTAEEIAETVKFQEQYFKHEVLTI